VRIDDGGDVGDPEVIGLYGCHGILVSFSRRGIVRATLQRVKVWSNNSVYAAIIQVAQHIVDLELDV
jgi:hypothetical protein